MSLKKLATTLSALTLAFGIAACGSGDEGSGGGVITAWGSEPQNPLIPANTNETGGGRIVDQLYSGLLGYDAEGKTHNEMAESIELEGKTTYKVTLKDDIKFSDGSPVESANFVDAWNYSMKEAMLSSSFFEPIKGYKEGAEKMDGLKVVDEKSFTIELKRPTSDFEQRLGYSAFFPLHESAYDDIKAYGENPIGNGPYKLESWNHNQDATLVPNEEYSGENKPKNDGIKFVFYATPDAAYADLQSGNLDVLDTVPDSAFTTFENDLGDRAANQPSAVFQAFTIPSNLKHFTGEEGKLRRQAISLGFDRKGITDTIFDGTRTPATDFTSPVIPGHSDSLKGADVLEYNPEKAKELWKKADEISKFTGEFTIAYNSDGGHQGWVDAVTNNLRNSLGIEASGKAYPDFKSLRDDITNGRIDGAFRSGWQADYPTLGNFLEPNFATGGSSNDGEYSSDEFDKLLQDAAAAKNVDEANPIYNKAQEVLLKDLPGIPMWYSNVTGGYSENVEGVVFNWKSVPEYTEITKK